MTRTVVTVDPGAFVSEAAKLLAGNGISAAPVVEDGVVVGILSESDILRVLAPAAPGRRHSVLEVLAMPLQSAGGRHREVEPVTVRETMTTGVACIRPEASMWEAAALMRRRGVKRLPVTEEAGALVGIVSRADLVRAMARSDESIRADVLHSLQTLGESSRGIDVDVHEGVVTLSGTAPDSKTIRAAEQLAQRVAGGSGLTDHVKIERMSFGLDIDAEDLQTLDPFRGRRPGARPSPGGTRP